MPAWETGTPGCRVRLLHRFVVANSTTGAHVHCDGFQVMDASDYRWMQTEVAALAGVLVSFPSPRVKFCATVIESE